MPQPMLCTQCGTVTSAESVTPGSGWMTLVLLLCFVVPGIIYWIWRHTSTYLVCPQCRSKNIVPLASPVAYEAMTTRPAVVAPLAVEEHRREDIRVGAIALAVVVALLIVLSKISSCATPSSVTNNSPPASNAAATGSPSPTTTPPDTQKEPPFQNAQVYATAEQLMIDRQTGGAAAAEKYLGKVIEVQGVVDTASSTGDSPSISFHATGLCVILGGNSVNCFWMAERERSAVAKLHPGDSVAVLGRFEKSGRYEMPKEYDIPGCAFYINLDNCTVKGPTQTLASPETGVPGDQSAVTPAAPPTAPAPATSGDVTAPASPVNPATGEATPGSAPSTTWHHFGESQSAPSSPTGTSTAQKANATAKGVPTPPEATTQQSNAASIREAAEQGSALAQYKLGLSYFFGDDGPPDDADAYFWLSLAASGKIEGVQQEDIVRYQHLATLHLTRAELSQVRERVRKWFEEHPPKVE
jgi:tRNA_anti-like